MPPAAGTAAAQTPPAPPQPAAVSDPPPAVHSAEAFRELVRRANSGDARCLVALRQILDQRPDIWRVVGDVSAVTRRVWVDRLAGGDKLAEESIDRHIAQLRAQLAGADPTPLESLLVDYVGATWLAVQHAESAAAEVASTLQQVVFKTRRAESAGRRFAGAVRLLIMVRALLPRPAASKVKERIDARDGWG